MIQERSFIRAAYLNSWCAQDDPLHFTVDSDGEKILIFDLWADPTREGLTFRVSFNAIGFRWTRDLQIPAATVRAVAQFLLRRLRSLDAMPAANGRLSKKVN